METKELLAIKTFQHEWDFETEIKLYNLIEEKGLSEYFLKVISTDYNYPFKLIMERGACDL